MGSSSLSLSLILVLFSLLALTVSQPNFSCIKCNNTHGNYTSMSTYSKNLKILLSTISSTTQINKGFYNFSVGQKTDIVYGIAVCTVDDCSSCVSDATRRFPGDCSTQKKAIGFYYGRCMVRYSDRPIFGVMDSSPTPTCSFQTPGFIPDPDVEKFNQTLVSLMDRLRNEAAAGNSNFKLGTGDANVTTSLKIYAQTQCSPDLTPSNCSTCLQQQISQLRVCCSRIRGAAIYGPSCTVKFENYPFGNMASRTASQPSSSSSPSEDSEPGKRKRTYIIWIIIVILLVLFMLLGTLGFCSLRRRLRKVQKEVDRHDQIQCVDSLQFDLDKIQVATDNFSDARRLGKGDSVFQGTLPSGQEIAVKRQFQNGRDSELEFDNEVLLLSNLQHRNLVKLVGFCIEKELRLLMYEFQPNESLDHFLSDPVKRAQLDWEIRKKIILGIARGLLYLHEDSHMLIIHRDVKASHILLGLDMNPRISNFSKASRFHADQPRGDSRTIKGTYGYMPPEYSLQGHYSIKSDVFSFGVLLLEIISGQNISMFSDGENEENLLCFAWRKWSEGKGLDVADQAMPSVQSHTTQILRCIEISLLCVQEAPTCRPTMSTVVFLLNSNISPIAEPSRPALIIQPVTSDKTDQ